MNIEAINALWAEDCSMNLEELAIESSKIGTLHSKYYKIFIEERLRYLVSEEDLAKVKKTKRDYYSGYMSTEELKARGWEQFDLKLLRNEVNDYIDADEDILKLKLKLATQYEKLEYLKSILDQIKQRSFNIRNAVEWKKFEAGF